MLNRPSRTEPPPRKVIPHAIISFSDGKSHFQQVRVSISSYKVEMDPVVEPSRWSIVSKNIALFESLNPDNKNPVKNFKVVKRSTSLFDRLNEDGDVKLDEFKRNDSTNDLVNSIVLNEVFANNVGDVKFDGEDAAVENKEKAVGEDGLVKQDGGIVDEVDVKPVNVVEVLEKNKGRVNEEPRVNSSENECFLTSKGVQEGNLNGGNEDVKPNTHENANENGPGDVTASVLEDSKVHVVEDAGVKVAEDDNDSKSKEVSPVTEEKSVPGPDVERGDKSNGSGTKSVSFAVPVEEKLEVNPTQVKEDKPKVDPVKNDEKSGQGEEIAEKAPVVNDVCDIAEQTKVFVETTKKNEDEQRAGEPSNAN